MKGDVGKDVRCPKCGDVLHPRTNVSRLRNNTAYWATAEHVERASLRQHLHNMHPELRPREVSLILDRIHDFEVKVVKVTP